MFGALVSVFGAESRTQTGLALALGGGALLALGCLRVRRIKLPLAELEAEHPEETARYAEIVTEPGPDTRGAARRTGRAIATTVEVRDLIGASRYLAAERSLKHLLTPLDGPLANAEMHLYTYDGKADLLLPVFEPTDDESEGWRPSIGCVGKAWSDGELVVAKGSEASDATFGLDEARQHRYRELTAVAATPVMNRDGEIIAVLAASTDQHDEAISGEEGQTELLALAEAVARILIDLLKWFSDGAEGQAVPAEE
jgi:hypothetical protein